MLTTQYIREHHDIILERLAIKHFSGEEMVARVIELDDLRKKSKAELDQMQAKLNQLSKEIGTLFKNGKTEEAGLAREETVSIKEEIKKSQNQLSELEAELQEVLIEIPNVPHESVPPGKSSAENVVIKEGGPKPPEGEHLLPHWELGPKLDILDFELGNKLTGSGFPVMKGKGARLQRALISFFLDCAIQEGYEEVIPPLMVNEESGFGTGQLPDKEGQMYHVPSENLYLIPTAEVPVTNIYRDTILNADELPIKKTAYTPCFRREAGSYGKDVRGLNRVHQFDKVEIVQITHPEQSYNTLEKMVNYVETLLIKLELPYRIVKLCGGDIGFTSALTYDFEVFSAAQKRWLEVSSVSNFESFQANRLKLRLREADGKKTIAAHTLNGSALALPRIVAALLENYQTGNGIKIPEVLVPYTQFDFIDGGK
jgi:seryl-tRNA synthetase